MTADTVNGDEKLPTLKKVVQQPKRQAIVAILLLLLFSWGIYVWQNSKIKDLNSQISDVKSTSKTQSDTILSQSDKIADLEKQMELAQSNSQSAEDDAPGLKVTVKSATRIDTRYSGKDYVAVTVSVSNSGSTSVPLSLTSFKLTDADNNKYPSVREQQSSISDYNYVVSILNLPKNSTLLTDQTVSKNETVAGILVFYAANSISDFTLSYQGSNYQLSLD